jgi:hypothetical protein
MKNDSRGHGLELTAESGAAATLDSYAEMKKVFE